MSGEWHVIDRIIARRSTSSLLSWHGCNMQKLLYKSVLAMLKEQLDIPDMVVLVLPALIAVVQHVDANEYKKNVQSEMRRILTMARPVQVKYKARITWHCA